MTRPQCLRCGDHGLLADACTADYCTCLAGAMLRKRSNLHAITSPAIAAYARAGREPITSASNAASWDEVESALDTCRLQSRHICRSCDKPLPSDAKCGERCERCADELAALSKPTPAFKLTKWELRCLYLAAIVAGTCIGGLIYLMAGGRL